MVPISFQTTSGDHYLAEFFPEKGMNLINFSKNNVQILDIATKNLFDERMAGLGALIGPHFHHRIENEIPKKDYSNLFDFTKSLAKEGKKELFSHGIARYVPWSYQSTSSSISAKLCGEDVYKGVALKDIEGKNFQLSFQAQLSEDGLSIRYQFKAEKPSVIGLHYYYVFENEAIIKSFVGENYCFKNEWKPIPKNWLKMPDELYFKLDKDSEVDYGFRSAGNALESQIELDTKTHQVLITFQASCRENSWQLYKPKGTNYICIEPLTAKNPRQACLTSGELHVQIKLV